MSNTKFISYIENRLFGGDRFMVICTKCGAENKVDAKFCSGCGDAFGQVKSRDKNPKDDCFGLPHGGAIFGLFIGSLIIIWGVTQAFGWEIEQLGPYAIIIFGIIILAGAFYKLTRKK